MLSRWIPHNSYWMLCSNSNALSQMLYSNFKTVQLLYHVTKSKIQRTEPQWFLPSWLVAWVRSVSMNASCCFQWAINSSLLADSSCWSFSRTLVATAGESEVTLTGDATTNWATTVGAVFSSSILFFSTIYTKLLLNYLNVLQQIHTLVKLILKILSTQILKCVSYLGRAHYNLAVQFQYIGYL